MDGVNYSETLRPGGHVKRVSNYFVPFVQSFVPFVVKKTLSIKHSLKIEWMEHHALFLVKLDGRERHLDEIQAIEQEFQKV